MTARQEILIVDDEPHIRDVLRYALSREGYVVQEASNGRDALDMLRRRPCDLLILDILMPEMDGTELCREIRRDSLVPIIFLSSKDDEVDRVIGLELGGDDYITKPFSPREVVARVRAVLRRGGAAQSPTHAEGPERQLKHGGLWIDIDRRRAGWRQAELSLTATEFGILATLMRSPGRVYTREELMSGAYPDQTTVSDRTIDSHVRRVRQKIAQLGGTPIETVHSVGFRLTDPNV